MKMNVYPLRLYEFNEKQENWLQKRRMIEY